MHFDPKQLYTPDYIRAEIQQCRGMVEQARYKTGLVVDGNNVMYRLAFASTRDINGADDLLAMFKERVRETVKTVCAEVVVCAIDSGVSMRRSMLGAKKKSDKNPEQEAVVAIAREALHMLRCDNEGFNPRWMDGYEADDIAAAFAVSGLFLYTVVYSTDSDLYQVTGNTVAQLSPANGNFLQSPVPPALVAGVKALAGDSSDNVEGIKGVGPKTALAVLTGEKTLDLNPEDTLRVLNNLTLTSLPFPGSFRCLEQNDGLLMPLGDVESAGNVEYRMDDDEFVPF